MKIWTDISPDRSCMTIYIQHENGRIMHTSYTYNNPEDMNKYLSTHIIPHLETLTYSLYPHRSEEEFLSILNARIVDIQKELVRLNNIKESFMEKMKIENLD